MTKADTDIAALAREIADAAATDTLDCALTPMPGSDGWLSTLLPRGSSLDEVRDVRRALRYLHLRGLITDHPQRPWVRLTPPEPGAPRKSGRPGLRVAAR